ncbi:MAG: tetratricopeptide repeat protein [Xanthobacteraceae bacterium]|nr:tetratricopeptide repeat protein [Xanthobacteraceae bacterium]
MRSMLLILLLAAAAFAAVPASAQTSEDCYRATLRFNGPEIISACSAALERGGLNKNDLSIVYSNRALGYMHQKQWDEAIADLSESLTIDGTNQFAFNSRGQCWSNKKNYERAFADFDEALRLDPEFTGAYLNRGFTYQELGDTQKAIAQYRLALQQTGTREIDKWARARAQERLNELER